jgi:pimeloyl-ACP methyl ester carboxylesterase
MHVQVGDLNVYYEEIGHGFPVLLIMGLSANVDWWPPMFVEPLARNWRLILFDNRGAGRTKGDHSRFSIPLAAQDSLRLLDELKIERAHVIGMSMGGMIAQEMTLAAPERVAKLVLACTTCGVRSGSVISQETLKLAMRYVLDPATRRRSRAMNVLSCSPRNS